MVFEPGLEQQHCLLILMYTGAIRGQEMAAYQLHVMYGIIGALETLNVILVSLIVSHFPKEMNGALPALNLNYV